MSSFSFGNWTAGLVGSSDSFGGTLLGSGSSSMSGPGYSSAFNTTNPLASTFATEDALARAQALQTAGAITQIGGAITQEISRYYQAKQAQYEAKSKASAMRFQADMANVSASMAVEDAASILEAGQQQKAQLTMRAGLEMAQELTRQGARGVRIGAGSAAETQASLELIKEIDAYNIDSNALRQSQARRMQAVNLRAQGLLGGVSAQNIEAMSRTASTGATLLGGASRIGGEGLLYYARSENRNPRYNYFGGR